MDNSAFPLSVQTDFVESLDGLSHIPGAVDVVALGVYSPFRDSGEIYHRYGVTMLGRYHSRSPLSSVSAKDAVVGRDRSGAVVVPAPVDYVSWTKRIAYFAHRRDLAAPKRIALLTGQMSPMAKRNFQKLGWTIYERVSL